jgi:hypothetical protein
VVATADGVIDVYVRGMDDRLWQRWWKGGWSPGFVQLDPEFRIASSPVVVSLNPAHRAIFVRGQDGSVCHKGWDGNWQNWESLGGQIKDAPGVVRTADGVIDVYVRGMDDRLWQRWWHGGWSPGFIQIDSDFLLDSSPVVVSLNPMHRSVFVRGADTTVWERGWGP